MENLIGSIIPTGALAFALAGAIIAVARWLDKTLPDEARWQVSLWWIGEAPDEPDGPLLSSLYYGLLGDSLSIKRLAASTVLTFGLGSAAYLWFGLRHFTFESGWAFGSGLHLEGWVSFFSIAALYLLPVQYISLLATGWLVHSVLAHPTWPRVIVFVSLEVLLALFTGVLVMNIVLAPYAMVGRGWLIAQVWLEYSNFIADNYFVITNEVPIAFAELALPIFWIVAALVTAIAGTVATKGSKVAGRFSRLINHDRVEKEPVTLVAEPIAAIVFVLTLAMGVFLSPA